MSDHQRTRAMASVSNAAGWRPYPRLSPPNKVGDFKSLDRGILMGPHPNDCPASFTKTSVCVAVSAAVALDLRSPPIRVRPRPRHMVRAPVPEATVHEDCDSRLWKDDVGLSANARQGPHVYAKPQPALVERRTQLSLRRGVPGRLELHPATHGLRGGFDGLTLTGSSGHGPSVRARLGRRLDSLRLLVPS